MYLEPMNIGTIYSSVNRRIYVALHSSINRPMYGGTWWMPKFYTSSYSLLAAPTVPPCPTSVFTLQSYLRWPSAAGRHLRLRPSPPLGTALGRLRPSSLTLTPGPPSGLRRVMSPPAWLHAWAGPSASMPHPSQRSRPPTSTTGPLPWAGRPVASSSFF
jgi:hypothetical protein